MLEHTLGSPAGFLGRLWTSARSKGLALSAHTKNSTQHRPYVGHWEHQEEKDAALRKPSLGGQGGPDGQSGQSSDRGSTGFGLRPCWGWTCLLPCLSSPRDPPGLPHLLSLHSFPDHVALCHILLVYFNTGALLTH